MNDKDKVLLRKAFENSTLKLDSKKTKKKTQTLQEYYIRCSIFRRQITVIPHDCTGFQHVTLWNSIVPSRCHMLPRVNDCNNKSRQRRRCYHAGRCFAFAVTLSQPLTFQTEQLLLLPRRKKRTKGYRFCYNATYILSPNHVFIGPPIPPSFHPSCSLSTCYHPPNHTIE